WADANTIVDDDPVALAERVSASLVAAGADAVNLRVHMNGVPPAAIRDQITALAAAIPCLDVS
ncbi:MAG: hypothetical protein WDA60_19215, partial [Acidimicrobiia bacterium]